MEEEANEQQDEYIQGGEPEKKPFEVPKEGTVFILDCHNYNNMGMDEKLKEAVLNHMRRTPVLYPKDRFALVLFGVDAPSEKMPNIVLSHFLGFASGELFKKTEEKLSHIVPSTKVTPLISVLEFANTIFERAVESNLINQRRIVFVVPPAFFETHEITPEINAYVTSHSVVPIIFSSHFPDFFPFPCFQLERLERVSIAFHKSYGYYYDFVPFNGTRCRVIVNNIFADVRASTLGNVLVEKQKFRRVVGKIRKDEIEEAKLRELPVPTDEDGNWEYAYNAKKLVFTEDDYQKLHRIPDEFKNSIRVRGKIDVDLITETIGKPMFIRPTGDSVEWYEALYKSLYEKHVALRCDFLMITAMRDSVVVALESFEEIFPRGLYILVIPFYQDYLTINYGDKCYDYSKIEVASEANLAVKRLIETTTKENLDLLQLKNPAVQKRLDVIAEIVEGDVRVERNRENERLARMRETEDERKTEKEVNEVSAFFYVQPILKNSSRKQVIPEMGEDEMLKIFNEINDGKYARLTVPILKSFLMASHVVVTNKDKKMDLLEKAKRLVEKIQSEMEKEDEEAEQGDNANNVEEAQNEEEQQ
ncbi:hypothetical protein EIN_246960 [Entamoeba invadens IP1]|uniref:Ku domain-containing protein n=1 Tax=Entamoeba invadens IP1 TaxID=370355 RepID=A0A0A1UH69_ENTIV|nr:hypothetical protein EIN_246960 [Entamoeba invadens IP1]ELP94802.1 hypothetical protein EIN_246960 [Entamoeba invadens IP1]|eukprot:XP_004261573.1 hypothetical protein EIN_246960 [Entamoeba invadens IP1]